MKKSLIALAVSGALIAPAAMADSNVTVYGVANVSYDIVSVTQAVPAAKFSNNKVSSNVSRLGFKGNEDLGDGLSAIWQIESLINIDNSNAAGNTLASRNTFAGLSSTSLGTVLLGRHDTPYNIATRKLDLFGDTAADNRSIMGGGAATTAARVSTVGASFDGRQPDVIAYISPSLSGFTGAIAYVAGADAAVANQKKGRAWSMAGLYGAGPFYGSLAYEVHDLGTAGTGTLGTPIAALAGLKEKAVKLGLGYADGPVTVNFAYEKLSDNFAGAGANLLGHSSYYIGTKYAFGNDAVKLAATKAGSNSGVATGASQVSLGYDHSLSKRTTVYALYSNLKNDTNGLYGLSTNGTGAPAVAVATTGTKESVISFGLKHTF